MKSITRNTAVVSVSLPKRVVEKLEAARKARGQSRSAFIAALVEQEAERRRWETAFEYGRQTGRRLGITNEDDVNRIIHEYRREERSGS